MPIDAPTITALYARVSSTQQERESTIDSQVAALHALAARNGWEESILYADNGYTGSSLIRPELDRLRDDVRRGAIARVLILHPDRLSRGKPYQRALVEDELRTAGVELFYVSGGSEDSAEGRLMSTVIAGIAEYERERITDRMRRGQAHKIEKGEYWRPKMYAIAYTPPAVKGQAGSFAIVEEEAVWLRRIFAWVTDGKSLQWIGKELRRLAVPSSRGGAWAAARISQMVHNPIYSGRVAWGRTVNVEPARSDLAYRRRRRSSRRDRPSDTWKFGSVPAIVSVAEQEAACAALESNLWYSRRNAKHDYLLSGLVRCGLSYDGHICNYRMTGSGGVRTIRRYKCRGKHADETPCSNKVVADVIEQTVWDRIADILRRPDLLAKHLESRQTGERGNRSTMERHLDKASATLESTQIKLDRLLEKHLADGVDDATYERMQSRLIGEREAALGNVAEARSALDALRDREGQWRDIRALCADYAAKIDAMDGFTERQQIVRLLVREVRVEVDGVIRILGILPLPGPPTNAPRGAITFAAHIY